MALENPFIFADFNGGWSTDVFLNTHEIMRTLFIGDPE